MEPLSLQQDRIGYRLNPFTANLMMFMLCMALKLHPNNAMLCSYVIELPLLLSSGLKDP